MRLFALVLLVSLLVAGACDDDAVEVPVDASTATVTPTATTSATRTTSATPTVTATPATTVPPIPDTGRSIALGEPFRLAVGEVARLPQGGSLSLRAVVADSRCPIDVVCVRAGDATAVFVITRTDGAAAEARVTVAPARGETVLDGHRLRVLDLRPYPRTTAPIAPSDYIVTIVIDAAGAASGGTFGLVTVGPMCPVQRVDQPCPDRPLAATLVIRDRAGIEVARAASDAAGLYAVALAAGSYTMVPLTPGGGVLPRGTPVDIEVVGGEWTLADISYDSGIR